VKLNWYDYGGRYYDPELGRFTGIDPLADDYRFQAPYVYAGNNPIRYEDFNGIGPRDRVKFAKNLVGTMYSMGPSNWGAIKRSGITWRSGGLSQLDCSELVYRTLEADGLVVNGGKVFSGQRKKKGRIKLRGRKTKQNLKKGKEL